MRRGEGACWPVEALRDPRDATLWQSAKALSGRVSGWSGRVCHGRARRLEGSTTRGASERSMPSCTLKLVTLLLILMAETRGGKCTVIEA